MESAGIGALIERMNGQLAELRAAGDARAAFHATYTRTTEAVGAALADGFFLDPTWVERWDVAFARLYLDALDADRRGEPVPRRGRWPSARRPRPASACPSCGSSCSA